MMTKTTLIKRGDIVRSNWRWGYPDSNQKLVCPVCASRIGIHQLCVRIRIPATAKQDVTPGNITMIQCEAGMHEACFYIMVDTGPETWLQKDKDFQKAREELIEEIEGGFDDLRI